MSDFDAFNRKAQWFHNVVGRETPITTAQLEKNVSEFYVHAVNTALGRKIYTDFIARMPIHHRALTHVSNFLLGRDDNESLRAYLHRRKKKPALIGRISAIARREPKIVYGLVLGEISEIRTETGEQFIPPTAVADYLFTLNRTQTAGNSGLAVLSGTFQSYSLHYGTTQGEPFLGSIALAGSITKLVGVMPHECDCRVINLGPPQYSECTQQQKMKSLVSVTVNDVPLLR